MAVKKLLNSRSSSSGLELSTLREIMLLQEIKHDNVIDLIEVFVHQGAINLVFEFCKADLEGLIKDSSVVLDTARVQGYMLGALRGIAHCHSSWVLHRDLKPGNLFVSPTGVVKVGDFGLARFFGSPERRYTGQVVTRWYRAPELLFGAKFYGPAVDMWSLGCIFAELLLRVPYFPGNSDIEQLSRIFTARGTPTERSWPGVSSLPDYIAFREQPGVPLRETFSAVSDHALELLGGLLALDPAARLTAQAALDAAYFAAAPPAVASPEKTGPE